MDLSDENHSSYRYSSSETIQAHCSVREGITLKINDLHWVVVFLDSSFRPFLLPNQIRKLHASDIYSYLSLLSFDISFFLINKKDRRFKKDILKNVDWRIKSYLTTKNPQQQYDTSSSPKK